MKDTDKVAQRLALLEGVDLSKADLESIAAEIKDFERVVAELEEFGQDTPWISLQVQPPSKKA
jgi:predicted TPR repeat methyltransferase